MGPFLVVSVVVTVPSFWVSTTRMEPSWNLVVSVTVPVFLSVTVVVLEPSLLVVVSAVVLLLEPPPPPEERRETVTVHSLLPAV